MHDLDGGERLDIEVAAASSRLVANGGDEIGVVLKGQIWMESADDVHLGRAGLDGLPDLLADIRHVARVGLGIVLLRVELAELAGECRRWNSSGAG